MQINSDLLGDIAQLLGRYSADDWRRLVDALEDEKLRSTVISTLRSLATLASSVPPSKNGHQERLVPRPKHKPLLPQLKMRDPHKFELLTRVRQKLIARELLPAAPELRAFGEKLGAKIPSDLRREQAVGVVLRALSEYSWEEIQEKLGINWSLGQNSGKPSQYDQWVEVIMGKKTGTTPR